MKQIKAQGVDPTQHIFVFNLRSYDRLNTTPAIKAQEEKSGKSYKEIQNAEAEEIMGSSTHPTGAGATDNDKSSETENPKPKDDDTGDIKKEEAVDAKRKFEAQQEASGAGEGNSKDKEPKTASTIAQSAMLNTKNVVDEHWVEGHGELERENFVQEELYIHAKVMIADDRIAICGSANINDRSQIGTHDSELAIVVEDSKELDSKMNGEAYKAGYMPATLRRRLWREHLGLLPPQDLDGSDDPNAQPPGDSPNDNGEGDEYEFVADPLCDKLWDMWTGNATTNTEVFRDLFHADPDNSIKTFDDYQKFTPNPKQDEEHKQGHIYDKEIPIPELKKQLDRIKGHLVWMPLDFLCEAEMAEKGMQVNVWTESVYA